jgi:hypothetical protein
MGITTTTSRTGPAPALRAPQCLVFLALAAIYLVAASRFQDSFLSNWTWSELLLHYEGGLVKRGLFGQIAYLVDPFVPAKYFVTATIFACYLAILAILTFELRLVATFAGLLFLFSPGGLLFPIYDLAAYGRKDAFVVLALGLAVLLVHRLKNATACFALILAIYTVAGLAIEIVWFYFPLAIAIYLHRLEKPSGWRPVALTAFAAAYAAVWLGINYVMSRGADVQAAVQSWLSLYPDADPGVFGLAHCCLKYKLSDALGHGTVLLHNDALRTGYLAGACLAALPLLALLVERRAGWGRPSGLVWLVLLAGAVGSLAPLALAADWGRYIVLALVCLFITVAGMTSAEGAKVRAPSWIAGVAITLYALSWQLEHFQLPDNSPLHAGPLLRGVLAL